MSQVASAKEIKIVTMFVVLGIRLLKALWITPMANDEEMVERFLLDAQLAVKQANED